jgi:hypothetical protein
MKLYDVPNVDHPLMLDEDFAATQGYELHSPQSDRTPPPRASKQEWVDFAVSEGADPEHAATLTKSDLIEQYGG